MSKFVLETYLVHDIIGKWRHCVDIFVFRLKGLWIRLAMVTDVLDC